jgi:anti-anti-sigma factor
MKPASGKTAEAGFLAESDVVVVRLPEAGYGSLDDAKLARARRLLLGLANQPGPPSLIVDLSGVHYLGAAFIGIVVSAWDELKKQGRQLVVCGLTGCANSSGESVRSLIGRVPAVRRSLPNREGSIITRRGRTWGWAIMRPSRVRWNQRSAAGSLRLLSTYWEYYHLLGVLSPGEAAHGAGR